VSGDDRTTPPAGIPPDLPDDPSSSLRPRRSDDPQTSTDPQMQARMLLGNDLEELARVRKDPSAYILRREVGHGTFGEVLEAVQVALHRVVAVKRPRTPAASTDSERADQSRLAALLFHKEALTTSHLDHPNIVPVYDLGSDTDGRPLLAMKLVEGVAWNHLLHEDLGLSLAEKLAKHIPTLLLVSRAVAFAHSRGIVHRDLKPSQVMVGNYGEVFLMDWGSAIAMPDVDLAAGMPASQVATPREIAPNPAGTVAYMAPEQTLRTPDQLGPWTDVYLLGGMLYEILTGTAPHPQERPADAFLHAARGIVELPSTGGSMEQAPNELSALCMWALAPRIAERMQTADEFVLALEGWLSGANLREQSRSLVADAQVVLEANLPGYMGLEQADALLTRALNAWAENREALEKKEHVLAQYVRAAISEGDLKLAHVQAERMPESELRDRLRYDVRRAEQAARRHRAQRRIAIAASLLLLVGISVLGLVIRYSAESDRVFEEHQHQTGLLHQRNLEEAAEQQQKEQRRGEQLGRLGQLREQTIAFVNRAVRDIPLPDDVELARDWSWNYLISQTKVAGEMRSALQQIDALRAQCQAEGTPVSPKSYEVLMAQAALALQQLPGQAQLLPAFSYYSAAAQLAAHRFDPYMGMAIAAARAGDFTSATRSLAGAVQHVASGQAYFDVVADLRRELLQAQVKGFVSAPGDIVIEAATNGINASKFHPTTNNWGEIQRLGGYKSIAPGLSQPQVSSARVFHFYEPYSPTIAFPPAVARWLPDPPVARKYHVYATWPPRANAMPVRYKIRHAEGETSLTIRQDGWGHLGSPDSHLWVSLGEFTFAPGQDTYVELEAGTDIRPITPQRHGEVVADAMYFATKPLDLGTTMPTLASSIETSTVTPAADAISTKPKEIEWETDLAQVRQRAKTENRAMLLFICYPVSATFTHPLNRFRDYCENRLFVDPALNQELKQCGILTFVDTSKHPDAAAELGVNPAGVNLCICAPDGTVRERLYGDALMLPPVQLIEKLRAAAGR
jgi:serine/threonine protein kinase